MRAPRCFALPLCYTKTLDPLCTKYETYQGNFLPIVVPVRIFSFLGLVGVDGVVGVGTLNEIPTCVCLLVCITVYTFV